MARQSSPAPSSSQFLPITQSDMKKRGWDSLDIIIVSGDAYVDHPGFAAAVLGRYLEAAGFRVGIISQPAWDTPADFTKLGKPNLFFAISAGNLDSMVNHYTAAKKIRRDDAFSPEGIAGKRPNRACVVYSNKVHEAYPDVPIVIGGIEASLRRFAQYDYWSDKVRQSILADTPADILIYGMGETQILEIANRLKDGVPVSEINDIAGTAVKVPVKVWRENPVWHDEYIEIPDFNTVSKDKEAFAKAFAMYSNEQDPIRGKAVVQRHPKTVVIQNKPAMPLTSEQLDSVFELPYTRQTHPSAGYVPALVVVKFSITTHRGCFGTCSFCALAHHQGRMIQSRSMESILRDAETIAELPDYKGIINGLGGPSANMYMMGCAKQKKHGCCADKLCLYPDVCKSLDTSHKEILEVMRRIRELPYVKHVFVGYGVRYDLAMCSDEYMDELVAHHVSGQLKVAPEHVARNVTDTMRKPPKEVFSRFLKMFYKKTKAAGKEQYLIPFLISGHPGSTLSDMVELAEYLRDNNLRIEQVQDFTPTPMTVAACMYHTGLDPATGKKVYVATTPQEKKMQRALLQYDDPKNRNIVIDALKLAGRSDLIGNGPRCLVSKAQW